MIKKKIRRLWHGLASMRDYEVINAINKNQSVQLTCGGVVMTLSVEELKEGFDATKQKCKSKYNPGQEYSLVDFRWRPDDSNSKRNTTAKEKQQKNIQEPSWENPEPPQQTLF